MHSSPRKCLQEKVMSRSGSVPNLSNCQSPTYLLTNSPAQSRNSSKYGKEPIITKGRLKNRSNFDAVHLNRLGKSFDETGPYNKSSSPVRGKDYLQAMINIHASKMEKNKMSETAKRHILSRQKKVENYEHQSANSKVIKSRR